MRDDGIPEPCDNDWSRKAGEIDRQISKLAASIYPAQQPTDDGSITVDAAAMASAMSHLGRIADHCRGLAATAREYPPGQRP